MSTLLKGAVLHLFAPPPSLAAAYDTPAAALPHLGILNATSLTSSLSQLLLPFVCFCHPWRLDSSFRAGIRD
jgi:hypothetical protein